MPISILAIGDPHFKTNNVEETEQMATQILIHAKKISPDIIVVLGDILDTHSNIHVTPLTMAIEFLHSLSDISPVYAIIGNHDRPNNSDFLSDYHPFSALHYHKNIYIIDKGKIITYKKKNLLFVPYVYPGRFFEAVNELKVKIEDMDLIFAHQEFKGCRMGAIVSEIGDEWPITHPVVISGHIHDYQRPQKNIIYTGTPIQHKFGDSPNKSISHFLLNKNNELTEKRIKLDIKPKVKVHLSHLEILNWKPPDDKIVKVVVSGNPEQMKVLMKSNVISKLEKQGIKVGKKTLPMGELNIDDNMENKINVKTKSFLESLRIHIENDKEQLDWYTKILIKN